MSILKTTEAMRKLPPELADVVTTFAQQLLNLWGTLLTPEDSTRTFVHQVDFLSLYSLSVHVELTQDELSSADRFTVLLQ